MSNARVRCSLPVVLKAPKMVPMMAHTKPIKATNNMNHRIDSKLLHAKHDFVVGDSSGSLITQFGLK